MFSLAVFFLLVGFAHFVMGQSHVLHPPGRSDIAYHFIQTKDTYIRLTAPADIDWAVLAYRQSQPISGSRFSVMAPDIMSLFLSSSESAVYTETGSSSPECFVFKAPPFVHDGVVVTEFRCMGRHIFVDMYGNDNMNDPDPVPQLVGRSALPADEATSGSSQSTSATPADMGPWMAKINKLMKIRTVHGSIMSVVFLLLYPTFASFNHLLPPSLPVVKIHAALQSVTATLTVAGFGLGLYLTREVPTKDKYDQVIGAIVIVHLVIVQPIMGILQHRIFRKTQRKTWWAYEHRWLGRCMLVLGVINGGLGRYLSGSTSSGGSRGALIGFGVVAGIIYSLYAAVVAFSTSKQRKASKQSEITTGPEDSQNVQEYPLTEVRS